MFENVWSSLWCPGRARLPASSIRVGWPHQTSFKHILTYTHTSTHPHAHTHTHIHTHIHTHTHTHTSRTTRLVWNRFHDWNILKFQI